MSRTTDDVEHVTLEVEDEHLVLVPDIEDVEDLDVEDVLTDIDAVVLNVEDEVLSSKTRSSMSSSPRPHLRSPRCRGPRG